MPGRPPPAAGSYRCGREPEACEPALEPEKAHEHRVSLEPNERNFLFPVRPSCVMRRPSWLETWGPIRLGISADFIPPGR